MNMNLMQAVTQKVSAVVVRIRRFKPWAKTTLCVVGSSESGQGSCVFLNRGDTTVVLDCGGSSASGSGRSQKALETIAAAMLAVRTKLLLVISHFHHDHWGALPAIVEAFRKVRRPLPSIVSTDTTWKLLERYLFEGTRMSGVMLELLGFRSQSDNVKLFNNSHSVPGSASVLVRLGSDNIFYSSDCYDIELPDNLPKVDLLIMDSTRADRPGFRKNNEDIIRQNILALIRETLDRSPSAKIYIAMFSTQLDRAMWIEQETIKLTGLPPMINGLSLFNNLNEVRTPIKGRHNNRVVLVTGAWAQGQEYWDGMGSSALVRLSNGTDRRCQLTSQDTVVISASIPTWSNQLASQIRIMCERLKSFGVRLVLDTSAPAGWDWFAERREVHSGGHGYRGDILELIRRINPRQVMPFHASRRALEIVAKHCREMGIGVIMPKQGILVTL